MKQRKTVLNADLCSLEIEGGGAVGEVILSGKGYFTEVEVGANKGISINKMTEYLCRLKSQATF